MLERQHSVLVRKKLPWLDGGKIPGQFDSKESLELDNVNVKEPVPPSRVSDTGRPAPLARSDAQPGQREYSVKTRQDAKKAMRTTSPSPPRKGSIAANSASSLYSATPPADRDSGIQSHTKADSYERLIRKPESPPRKSRSDRKPHHEGNGRLPKGLAISGDEPVSPREQQQQPPQAQVSGLRRSKPKPPGRPPTFSESQAAADPGLEFRAQLRKAPTTRTLPRRSIVQIPSVVKLPSEVSAEPPPPAPLTRKSTLFAMPNHLMISSSSSSQGYMSGSPPQSLPAPMQRPPALPAPPPPPPTPLPPTSPRNTRRESESLNRAVTGLENLMQEALNVARDAAQTGRNDEVAGILDNATHALRRASTVHGQLNIGGRMSQPLVLSPPVSEASSRSASSRSSHSSSCSSRSDQHSTETAPTFVTKDTQSGRPVFVEQKGDGYFTRPQNASFESVQYPGAARSPGRNSISRTPPRLYQPASADSIVRDFAYARAQTAKAEAARRMSLPSGAADDYYADAGQPVTSQPGVRASISAPVMADKPPPGLAKTKTSVGPSNEPEPKKWRKQPPMQHLDPVPTLTIPPRTSSRTWNEAKDPPAPEPTAPRRRRERQDRPTHHVTRHFESSYYRQQPKERPDGNGDAGETARGIEPASSAAATTTASTTATRYDPPPPPNTDQHSASSRHHGSEHARYSDPRPVRPPLMNGDNISLRHPRRKHISLREGQGFSLGRHHKRQPIAREWGHGRKRITATIACLNTVFIGLITGIYAGEVPRIQYQLADTHHRVILGNVVLFATLGLTTLIFWPLPLLHGRKPYTLVAFALMLPLMFPQAIVVSSYRDPNNAIYRVGLLLPRAFQGIAMGFANINFLPTLFDLFGASLMSAKPHQEIVVYDDVRRQGGGVGIWLGIWSFCFVGSMAIGFSIGAFVIATLDPSWGFYLVVILLAFFLLVNVVAPETRRAPYRRSIAQFLDGEEKIKRRVARGEVQLHISNDGPKWWFQEVGAGLILTKRMLSQLGFAVMVAYLGWMYAQVTLVILLLGALLTRDYRWRPQYVGFAVLSVAIGALLAIPLSKANLFSRARDTPQRTDSMTMAAHHTHKDHVHWSSHMLRRCLFTLMLPVAGIAYTLTSPGPSVSWTAPTVFCGAIGFLSNLAIAECVGLIMETFDTCDLQPGVNQKHRLQSMAEGTRRRRTNYSSFPRICAGFFAAQSTGFFLSAAATGVSGDITRAVGAQVATAIVAGILLVLTVLLILVLWRWRAVKVIPDEVFGGAKEGFQWAGGAAEQDPEWRPVIIGNPSGKMRRENLLEMGSLSRWTEIQRLNKLVAG